MLLRLIFDVRLAQCNFLLRFFFANGYWKYSPGICLKKYYEHSFHFFSAKINNACASKMRFPRDKIIIQIQLSRGSTLGKQVILLTTVQTPMPIGKRNTERNTISHCVFYIFQYLAQLLRTIKPGDKSRRRSRSILCRNLRNIRRNISLRPSFPPWRL